ncbi:DUF11 domain-containing protein, partial [Methanobrevibacter sp. OttesenSCG-928-K11]|nr:DUF11 domain-containing protein [Methanobrevibacter sp. OttesenSCG-928-K11]MDL2271347.1 DUF11 domain-containing protein [Methanobrevibacter sp. OttesenSCG-928-I08]
STGVNFIQFQSILVKGNNNINNNSITFNNNTIVSLGIMGAGILSIGHEIEISGSNEISYNEINLNNNTISELDIGGVGISIYAGFGIINGSNISYNTLSIDDVPNDVSLKGGAIFNHEVSNLLIENTEFIGNGNNQINGSAIYNGADAYLEISDSYFEGYSHLIYNDDDYDDVNDNYYYGTLYLDNNVMVSDNNEDIYNLGEIVSTVHVVFLDNKTIYVPIDYVLNITGQITDDNGNIIVGQNLTFNITYPNGTVISKEVPIFENGYYNVLLTADQLGTYIINGSYYDGALQEKHIYDIGKINVVDEGIILVNKTTNVSFVNIGDEIYYNVTITSNVDVNLTNITVKEYITKFLDYIDYIGDDWGYNHIAGLWFYQEELGPRETIVLTLIFKVALEYPDETLNNTVSVNANELPNNTNASSENINVTSPNLIIEKINNDSSVKYNQIINYTVKVTNNGNGYASEIYFEDIIPEGLTYLGFDGKDWSYNATNKRWTYDGSLLANQVIEIVLSFRVNFNASSFVNNTITLYNKQNPNGTNASSNNTNVSKLDTETTIDDVDGKPGETVPITGTVKDEDGNPVTDGTVKITLPDGTNVTVDLNDDGEYSYNWTIPKNSTPGKYDIEAEFEGNDFYEPSSDDGIFTIEKIKTIITIDDIEGKPGDNVIITGTVKDENGKPLDGNVILTLPDGTIVTVIAKDGEFEYPWTIPNDFKKGQYIILAEFEGDNLYNSSSAEGILNVIGTPGPTPTPTPTPVDEKTSANAGLDMEKTGNPIAILLLLMISSLMIVIRRKN